MALPKKSQSVRNRIVVRRGPVLRALRCHAVDSESIITHIVPLRITVPRDGPRFRMRFAVGIPTALGGS